MIQQWLTVAGIVLDFAGFMLLLREWWLAFFNEGRQMQFAEQLDRARAMRDLRNRSMGSGRNFPSIVTSVGPDSDSVTRKRPPAAASVGFSSSAISRLAVAPSSTFSTRVAA